MSDRRAPESPSFRRRLIKKRTSGTATSSIDHEPVAPPPSDDETDSQVDNDSEDTLREPDKGQVTVKEALEGLFSSKTVQTTHHDLILVKRYSHGKSFRQRLAYILFRHRKTSLYIRYIGLMFDIIGFMLYIAEAIYIDELLRSDGLFVKCGNLTLIDSNNTASIRDLFIVDKPYPLWIIQTVFAILCLIGATIAIYVKQEIQGSLTKHFIRHVTFSAVVTVSIGIAFFCTIFYPPCLHYLWIPSFLYCWPARHNLMQIILRNSEASFFKSFRGFRTTAISLASFLLCFILSCICFIHHFERLGNRINLFETYWFVVVTFSTVGYGDISPGHWSGQLIITLFIIAALLYLPAKIDKLWKSFTLHRKHYKRYTKTPVMKHIVFVAVEVKPLVLRDFLNEIYSESSRMDLQCVLLIEHELSDSVKTILEHPAWSQKVVTLRGNALKAADLARAEVRSADACFVVTSRNGSPVQADHITVMSAWTIKNYAPKVKLYVHIRRPQSKLHLIDIADQVICEGELTTSMLALNSICPGISTLSVLLMHTFTHEERSFNYQEYKWYEKCSPVEVYHVRLGDSRYFHHFDGKNFLFTSVIVYRKFHIVLLGVQPSGTSDIKFNPGINHCMHKDDICYYISDTHESNSDYQVVQPTCFQTGLWQTSATLGLLGMYISGINPANLFHQGQVSFEDMENGGNKKLMFPRTFSIDKGIKRNPSLESSLPHVEGETIDGSAFAGTDNEEVCIVDDDEMLIDEQLAVEMTNWQHDVQLGLQLLNYHAKHDMIHRPCVKLSIKCCDDHFSMPSRTRSIPVNEDHVPPVIVLDAIPEDSSGRLQGVKVEKSPQKSSQGSSQKRYNEHLKHQRQPAVIHLGTQDLSQVGAVVPEEEQRKLSHRFNFGSNPSLRSGASSILSTRSDKSLHSIDDIVSVQLDDISEVEELEDLEEGRQHHETGGGVFVSEENIINDGSLSQDSPLHQPQTVPKYIDQCVPTLPYCGCEPLSCHLTPTSRTIENIRIDERCFGDDIVNQWHSNSIIVYSDVVSPKLFHFIAPLRASYLPTSCLKPIVFILKQIPDFHFLSMISTLPMVYYMIGSILNTSDLLRAGILVAESLVILSSSETYHDDHVDQSKDALIDANHITAVNTIAKLFPHVRITIDVKFRYNIRFVHTTLYEQLSLQKLRHMARKGDHLTYLFLPQVSSARAFSSSMFDTLLYQSSDKPYLINLFRQLIGCTQVEGSGFLWKVPINEELARLNTYVRVFQRLAASYSFVPLALYRSAHVSIIESYEAAHIDSYSEKELEKLRKYLIGELHSMGIQKEIKPLKKSENQEFLYVNPPPDFVVIEGDVILGLRPPLHGTNHCDTHENTSEYTTLPQPLNPQSIGIKNVIDDRSSSTSPTQIETKSSRFCYRTGFVKKFSKPNVQNVPLPTETTIDV